MTIQVAISGHATGSDADKHTDQKAAEAKFIRALAGVVKQFGDDGNEVYEANASTSHHGTVDLLDHDWTRADDTEPRQDVGTATLEHDAQSYGGTVGGMYGPDSHGTA